MVRPGLSSDMDDRAFFERLVTEDVIGRLGRAASRTFDEVVLGVNWLRK